MSREILHSTDWVRAGRGVLEKTTHYSDRRKTTETNRAQIGKTIQDDYPDAWRRRHIPAPKDSTGNAVLDALVEGISNVPLHIQFKGEDQVADVFLPDNFSVMVSLSEEGTSWHLKQEGSTFLADYDQFGKLVAFFARPDNMHTEEIPEDEMFMDPKKSVPMLFNYLKATDDQILESLSAGVDLNISLFEADLEDRPRLIQWAKDESSLAFEEALDCVDEKDREELERHLNKVRFEDSIYASILDDLVSEGVLEVTRKLKENFYLMAVVEGDIFDIQFNTESSTTRVISFIDMTGSNVRHGEIEIENGRQKSIDMRSYGFIDWGESVSSQGINIEVKRENGRLILNWSRNGKIFQSVTAPFEIDAAKVREIGNDPDADFREIKDLIGANLLTN